MVPVAAELSTVVVETVGEDLWVEVELPPTLPSFSISFRINSLSACRFLSISWIWSARFFKSSALAASSCCRVNWTLSAQVADILLQRLDAFGLHGLGVEEILDLAAEFVDLLLGGVILGARRGQ